MDPNVKIILILIVFVIITVLLFNPSLNCSTFNEHFDNSFDTLDPAIDPYSKNIKYRPYSSVDTINDISSFKVYDQIDDQNNAMMQNVMSQYIKDNEIPIQNQKAIQKKIAGQRELMYSKAPVRNVDIRTSMDDTQINKNRVIESNNIPRFCMNTGNFNSKYKNKLYSDNMAAISDTGLADDSYHNMYDNAHNAIYCNKHRKIFEEMNTMLPIKTFVEVNDDFGDYYQNENKGNQDIKNLCELTRVMNMYKKERMNTINGGNNAYRYFC